MTTDVRTLDLSTPATTLAEVVRAIRDDQLAGPTPCPDYTVADLLDHVAGLAFAFTAAARKERLPEGSAAPQPDGAHLRPGWRDLIAERLDQLGRAWAEPTAYDGETQAGPIDLPAPVAASVALDEVVVHAWDLAAATGQSYRPDAAAVAGAQAFVDSFQPPPGSPATDGGLFGPPLDVPDGADPLERLLRSTGRDPGWTPSV